MTQAFRIADMTASVDQFGEGGSYKSGSNDCGAAPKASTGTLR
jgi:hypothetical protein